MLLVMGNLQERGVNRRAVVLWITQDAGSIELRQIRQIAERTATFLATELHGACDELRRRSFDAVVVHLPNSGRTAESTVEELQQAGCRCPIVVYEPAAGSSGAAELSGSGAFEHVTSPVTADELWTPIARAVDRQAINNAAMRTSEWRHTLVGSSSAMQEVREIIGLVGNRRSTVLITGETGTGKEIVAKALHRSSIRSSSRMVAVNCAALPDNLLEAELFGHTKGAFTGAVNARVGLFEQAQRSTIFLDEIGEMPLPLQAKLLRALQEREIHRIGSSEPVPIDVRVVAATNTNLLEAVANRRFREDLYYRLNVVPLRMPALRDRASDIPELAEHFLEKIAFHDAEYAAAVGGDRMPNGPDDGAIPLHRKQLAPEALDTLMKYSWPGNVRQLEHALEAAVALSGTRRTLYPGDFDLPVVSQPDAVGSLSSLDVPETGVNFEEFIMRVEKMLLERALAKSGGNKARAASMLKMKRTTLISKFKSFEACA